MMIRSIFAAAFFSVFLVFLFSSTSAQAQSTSVTTHSPIGLWLTENGRSVIAVEPCNDPSRLCGYIYWIIEGGMQHDSKNPVESLRDTPMCGLEILRDFRQIDARNWSDGKIYKADDGDSYNANMQLLPNGNISVRGYIGMPLFGKSQIWTPVNAADFPQCRAPNI